MKLNDREINRRRASGFTSWALLGVVTYLLFHLLDNLPLIFSPPNNIFFFFIYSVVTGNLFMSFLILYGSFKLAHNSSTERRIISGIDKSSSRLLFFYLSFLFTFISAINFYSALNVTGKFIYSWPYYIFGFFFLVQAFSRRIIKILWTRKIVTKDVDIPEIGSGLFASDKLRKFIVRILVVLGCLLLGTAIFTIKDLASQNYIFSKIEIIKLSIRFIFFLILFLIIIGQYTKKIKFDWLEALERRIVVEELKPQQIKTLFVKEFLGEKTLDWINSIQKELYLKYEDILKVINEAEKELKALRNINSDYIFEIETRRKNTCTKVKEVYENYYNFVLAKLKHFKILLKQSPPTSDEALALECIISELMNQSNSIKTKFDNLACLVKDSVAIKN
jgi:hypothetical protein